AVSYHRLIFILNKRFIFGIVVPGAFRPGYPALRYRFEAFLPEIIQQKRLWLAIFEKMASHASYP
ncbi:MAG: hypothetical protein JXR70_04755, partial [Spirochaetales bacterium]|nr:hypothetical protein [Spirochaetales bacterium]